MSDMSWAISAWKAKVSASSSSCCTFSGIYKANTDLFSARFQAMKTREGVVGAVGPARPPSLPYRLRRERPAKELPLSPDAFYRHGAERAPRRIVSFRLKGVLIRDPQIDGAWETSALPFSGGHGENGRAMDARLHAAAAVLSSVAAALRRDARRAAGPRPPSATARGGGELQRGTLSAPHRGGIQRRVERHCQSIPPRLQRRLFGSMAGAGNREFALPWLHAAAPPEAGSRVAVLA